MRALTPSALAGLTDGASSPSTYVVPLSDRIFDLTRAAIIIMALRRGWERSRVNSNSVLTLFLCSPEPDPRYVRLCRQPKLERHSVQHPLQGAQLRRCRWRRLEQEQGREGWWQEGAESQHPPEHRFLEYRRAEGFSTLWFSQNLGCFFMRREQAKSCNALPRRKLVFDHPARGSILQRGSFEPLRIGVDPRTPTCS